MIELKVKNIALSQVNEDGSSHYEVSWEPSWISGDLLQFNTAFDFYISNISFIREYFGSQTHEMVHGEPVITNEASQNDDTKKLYCNEGNDNPIVSICGTKTQKSNSQNYTDINSDRSNERIEIIFNDCENNEVHNRNEIHQYSSETTSTDTNIHECSICGMTFALKTYLERHAARCRDPQKAPFRCDECGAGFTTKGAQTMHHDTVHLKKREYPCLVCNKWFTRKHILQIHLATHSKAKNFQCNVCNKSFSQKSNLTRHSRIHENTKSMGYKCRYCGQDFTQNIYLQKHINLSHIDEKSSADGSFSIDKS